MKHLFLHLSLAARERDLPFHGNGDSCLPKRGNEHGRAKRRHTGGSSGKTAKGSAGAAPRSFHQRRQGRAAARRLRGVSPSTSSAISRSAAKASGSRTKSASALFSISSISAILSSVIVVSPVVGPSFATRTLAEGRR